jgi:hypothetical protein
MVTVLLLSVETKAQEIGNSTQNHELGVGKEVCLSVLFFTDTQPMPHPLLVWIGISIAIADAFCFWTLFG